MGMEEEVRRGGERSDRRRTDILRKEEKKMRQKMKEIPSIYLLILLIFYILLLIFPRNKKAYLGVFCWVSTQCASIQMTQCSARQVEVPEAERTLPNTWRTRATEEGRAQERRERRASLLIAARTTAQMAKLMAKVTPPVATDAVIMEINASTKIIASKVCNLRIIYFLHVKQ